MKRNCIVKTALGVPLAIGFGVCQYGVSHANPPTPDGDPTIDWTFDWLDPNDTEPPITKPRMLNYSIAAACEVAVNKAAPSPEPDPTVAPFTLGDAFRRAAAIWNSWGTPWTLVEGGAKIQINVNCLRIMKAGAQSQSAIDGLLGRFLFAPGHNVKGTIQFNLGDPTDAANNVPWGVDNNLAGPGADTFYDPIIVALHEIGHAFRLNDFAGAIGAPVGGNVMRGSLMRGVHLTNLGGPLPSARNPSPGDRASATTSANEKQDFPALPGWAGIALAGLLFVAGVFVFGKRKMVAT